MRHSKRKTFPAIALAFALSGTAARVISVKLNLSELARVGPPFQRLALLCLCLLMVAPHTPTLAQDPPLAAPTNLSASLSNEGVVLSWTAPAGQVDGYEILRRRPLQGETELATLVDDTGSADTTYTDTSATTAGERYVYRIKAIRGANRSTLSFLVSVDYQMPTPTPTPISTTASCVISAGDNHDILQCTVSAGDLAITSALWTPDFEARYAQTKDGPVVNWVIAPEYCGLSTTVTVEAESGDLDLPTAETTITLECSPAPSDELAVSCQSLIENSQHVLSCALSGGDQTVTSAQWTPAYDVESAQTTDGEDAAEATWVISAENCGQTTTVEAVPSAGETVLSTVSTTVTLPCVIPVDDDCSLANAIRSANGNTQVSETGDQDGNDDCEAGGDADDSATPPYAGDDIILLTENVTLTEALPSITSPIHIEGAGHTVSGDATYRVLMAVGGHLSINDLTITKGLASTVGGGIYVNSGSLSLTDSTIKDSKASDIGGAIYAIDSDVDIADTEISGNMTVKSHGGAVYFVSSTGLHTLDIVGATFKKNMATEDGGALKTAGGIATINKSTFVENTADEGGAIESSETTLNITNSTFSSNSAREGGGLSSFSSFVTLTHTTWAYNSAEEQGGGIAIIGWTGNFKIRNTLITNSASGGDCDSGPNPNIIIEFAGNFVQDGTCTPEPAVSQAALSDGAEALAQAQITIADAQADGEMKDAMISALSGDPPHHPLQWGSPAIDSANPMYCLLDDQPFTDRPQYGNCDIGAYEYPRAPDPPPIEQPAPPRATPTATSAPQATPTPTIAHFVCIANSRIIVRSPGPDLNCAEIDILTLDKHPALQGMRFAVRLWHTDTECLHTVSLGDNLYRLAIQYETTVEVLRRHNDLTTNELSVGQQLVLPHCAPDAGTFSSSAEVCFEAQGRIVLIDTSAPERPIHSIDSYTVGSSTCGQINQPGIVALVAADSA